MTSPEDSNLDERWWTANPNIPNAVGIPPPSGGGECQSANKSRAVPRVIQQTDFLAQFRLVEIVTVDLWR